MRRCFAARVRLGVHARLRLVDGQPALAPSDCGRDPALFSSTLVLVVLLV